MDNLFFDVGSLAGVIALVTILLNILSAVGLIKGDSKEMLANAVQTIVSIALTVIGMFFPDLLNQLPMLDQAAQLIAEFLNESMAFVLVVIPIFVKLGNLFHDVFTRIPFLNKFLGYQLSK